MFERAFTFVPAPLVPPLRITPILSIFGMNWARSRLADLRIHRTTEQVDETRDVAQMRPFCLRCRRACRRV